GVLPRATDSCGAPGLLSFFFQAEDGIRDYKVTGVQTCALPISGRQAARARVLGRREELADRIERFQIGHRVRPRRPPDGRLVDRSEERRVGKECRTRRWTEPYTRIRQRTRAKSREGMSGDRVLR